MKAVITFCVLSFVGLMGLPTQAGWLDSLTSNTATDDSAMSTVTNSNDLVGSVMSELGLSQTQAEGGLGSLLNMAKSSLSSKEFSTVAANIPDASSLLAAVPSSNSVAAVSGVLPVTGGLGASLQGSAMVLSAFETLGISADLAEPMINVVKSYLQESGADSSANLLMQGVSALL